MYRILTLNSISKRGLAHLDQKKYEILSESSQPDAILLRSFKMHEYQLPGCLKAVGRAGAGVNNIPVAEMSTKGIPVFNTPGANANAVKELVLAGMLLAARNICPAREFAKSLEGSDAEISKAVEDGKKNFVGIELPGRTLGVIGLGAIGVKVANSALALGMKVIGYDPVIQVQRAWELSSGVMQAENLADLLTKADFISLHVPLNDKTKDLLSAERIAKLKAGVVVLNFSRSGIVNESALLSAIKSGSVRNYVTDFVSSLTKDCQGVIALPHLGASTFEAEENCAEMIALQIADYLENGNIRNSVNFPDAKLLRSEDSQRICVINSNEPNMLAQISAVIGQAELNIADMLNKSRGELAYTMFDISQEIPRSIVEQIKAIKGVLNVRILR